MPAGQAVKGDLFAQGSSTSATEQERRARERCLRHESQAPMTRRLESRVRQVDMPLRTWRRSRVRKEDAPATKWIAGGIERVTQTPEWHSQPRHVGDSSRLHIGAGDIMQQTHTQKRKGVSPGWASPDLSLCFPWMSLRRGRQGEGPPGPAGRKRRSPPEERECPPMPLLRRTSTCPVHPDR
jgi:hypothetical protein